MAFKGIYDRADVAAIAKRVYTLDYKGIAAEIRPKPTSDSTNTLMPLVLEDTQAKLAGTAVSIPMDDVVSMRKRPLKETCCICDGEVERKALLMQFDDRMVPLHVWTPEAHKPGSPLIVFIHGGGFCFGDVEQYANWCAKVAELTGAVVVYPDYRFAPECPFPGPVDDCTSTIEWCAAHADEFGVDIDRLVVAGDSAGGSLTLAVVQRELDSSHPVKLAMPIYACTDCGPVPNTWSYELYELDEEQADAERFCINRTKGIGVTAFYVNNDLAKLTDPLISVVHSERLADFPRTVVVSAQYDYLRIQDEDFAVQLSGAGADVRLVRYLGVNHGFMERAGVLPQSEDLACLLADEVAKL